MMTGSPRAARTSSAKSFRAALELKSTLEEAAALSKAFFPAAADADPVRKDGVKVEL